MKHLLTITGLMTALAVVAAPEGFVTQSASGSTAATVYFEPGPSVGSLVVADVTSDKAASVLSWRVGQTQVRLLTAASSVTNLTVSAGTIPATSNLVSVTAGGTVAAHTAYSTVQVTNKLVTLANPIRTNMVAGDGVRELSGTSYEVTAFASTNVVSITTNSTVVAGTVYVLQRAPDQWQTNALTSWTTNGASHVLVFTNAVPFTPARLATLTTNLYTLIFSAGQADDTLVLDLTNGLARSDNIVLLPTGGGAWPAEFRSAVNNIHQTLTLTETNGVTFAAGDRVFLLGPAQNTPVGAATLRLFGDPIRILPAQVPGVLSVDGTSAVTINSATLKY